MHHLNCLVIESFAKSLSPILDGSELIDAFSNNQDECTFNFSNGSLKCRFFKGEVYFFYDAVESAKNRLFKPQFKDIHHQIVKNVMTHPFERSFHIEFLNCTKLLFKCHGRKSNIILFQDQESPEVFRKHLEQDENLSFENAYRIIQPIFKLDFVANASIFHQHYPYLPYEVFNTEDLSDEIHFEHKLYELRNMRSLAFNEPDFEIYPDSKNDFLVSLNRFSAHALRYRLFADGKNQLIESCIKAIGEKSRFIESNLKALEVLKNKRPDGEIGNIILANLHLINPGQSKAILTDIYDQSEITVSLDPDLTPVENAERYFKKEKGLPHSLQILENKIRKAQEELINLEQKLATITRSSDLKALKPLVSDQKKKDEEENLPFRKFTVEGFDVLVGKHAESNEKILNYYSDKNDLWLHAKDVSGSHVLIKCGNKEVVPENVLEKAASLAAYYSKNRKQSLVTVAYTQRKFVRKIKGAEKGKVTVSNEKSILVAPVSNPGAI